MTVRSGTQPLGHPGPVPVNPGGSTGTPRRPSPELLAVVKEIDRRLSAVEPPSAPPGSETAKVQRQLAEAQRRLLSELIADLLVGVHLRGGR